MARDPNLAECSGCGAECQVLDMWLVFSPMRRRMSANKKWTDRGRDEEHRCQTCWDAMQDQVIDLTSLREEVGEISPEERDAALQRIGER